MFFSHNKKSKFAFCLCFLFNQIEKQIMKTSTLKTLFLILFCGISTIITAQQYIGFKAGFLNSNSDFDFGINDFQPSGNGAVRPTVALFAEFETFEHHSFTPGIYFSQTGNSMWIEDSLYTSSDNRIDYIGVNLENRLKLFSDEFEVYGIVSPQFRWAVNAITNKGYPDSDPGFPFEYPTIKEKVDFEDANLKRFDMNLRTGVGLSKVNKHYKIILEWVYDISFFDISSDDFDR